MKNAQMTAGRFADWAKHRKKLAWIDRQIDARKWVYIKTSTRHTVIKPKDRQSFRDAGADLFRATKTGLYIARGRKFDCIDWCNISAADGR